jgi:malate dehydrogenase (oxaloacetate-decarboxylating)(NADP+)
LAYNEKNLSFGRNYIIPKPVDPRLITTVSIAVAKAAMESGIAQNPITNWEAYEQELAKRLGLDNQLMRYIINRAKRTPKRVVFADAENLKVLKAVQQAKDEGICIPILLGNVQKIQRIIEEHNLELGDVKIIDTRDAQNADQLKRYGDIFFEKRKRRGYNQYEAHKQMQVRNYFAAMMVETGDADCVISGLTRNYPNAIRPALQVIGRDEGVKKVSGMYILLTKKGHCSSLIRR